MVVEGVTSGLAEVEVNPSEPVQTQEVAAVEFEYSVAAVPAHTRPLLVAPVEDGSGLTVTVVVYTVVGLQPYPMLVSVSE